MERTSRYFAYCIIAFATLYACGKERAGEPNPTGKQKEIEIVLSTAPVQTSRAPLDGIGMDEGNHNENRVETLDLLVFGSDGGFLYSREATALTPSGSEHTFRTLLQEAEDTLTVHLLANCRTLVRTWEAEIDRTGLRWESVHGQLIDTQPERLVNSASFEPLPMWGTIRGTISGSYTPKRWGPVQMLRSVASVDLFVARTSATAGFELSDLFVCFAADRGAVGARGNGATDPVRYVLPVGMSSSLHAVEGSRMQATGIASYNTDQGAYDGIAYQMYVYENYFTTTSDESARPMRAVVAGIYDGQKSYYPIDFLVEDGVYRPIIRNWKYEFRVTSVAGPGYATLEEAARGVVADINVEVIAWNKEDVTMGVQGLYYASMPGKEVVLQRTAGSSGRLKLTYTVRDGGSEQFSVDFTGAENGTQQAIPDGIRNDFFSVVMIQTSDGAGNGTVVFEITALQDNTAVAERTDSVTVTFRELFFTLSIRQLDGASDGWEDGGEWPVGGV